MFVVDAQIHLWTGDGAPPHHQRSPFSIDDALRGMDDAGVGRAVNCPAIWDAASNGYGVTAHLRHPERFASLGWFDTTLPRNERLVQDLVSRPGMLGLRFVLASSVQETMLREGALEWVWAEADRLALPVALFVRPSLIHEVARIATRYPRMRLLIDHIGVGPFEKLPAASDHLPEVLGLARLPNVAVKATGTASMATDGYPFTSTHEVLQRTFDAFGPRRMFWGTDITRMSCSWSDCIRSFTEELPWLKGDDLNQVMGLAICDWIGWRHAPL